MRGFLPIKGPGGRYLTPNEKVALLVLGFTLVLCALTLLAGEEAYSGSAARNPVFGFVSWLCRQLGAGVVAFYCVVLVWSGLIFFKGERTARVAPLGGRLVAALAITVGVSGALGIAHLQTAGGLGVMVGGALGNTLGAAVGFTLLLLLMLLGIHLAGQGAWSALREPMSSVAVAGAGSSGIGVDLREAGGRRSGHAPLPDDGDPSSDERSLAVTQAMEEIERSQGVTIVDVEPETEEEEEDETAERESIGEEVDAAGPPAPETEEAEIQRGLEAVAEAMDAPATDEAEIDETGASDEPASDEAETGAAAAREAEEYDSRRHGLVPVPPGPEGGVVEAETEIDETEAEEDAYEDEYEDEDAEYEDAEEAEYDEVTDKAEDDPEEAEYEEVADDSEEAHVEDEPEEAEYEEETVEVEEEPEEAEYDEETIDVEDEPEEAEYEDEEAETPVPQADGATEQEPAEDPYAQGGLLRRLQAKPPATEDGDKPYTSFDWRGRPLD